MAGETTTADTVITTDDQDNDADFDAGFAAATLGTTETPSNKDTQQDPAEKDTAAQAAAAAASTPAPAQTPPTETPTGPEPKMVQISEEELTALRTRATDQTAAYQEKFDKVFGQVGALKQAIDKLRTDTPAGEKVEITETDFKELVDVYPEIGKLTAQGLNKVLAKFKGTGGADPETIDRMVEERVQQRLEPVLARIAEADTKVTEAVLNGIVPRWREVVKAPAFDEWLTAQPQDVQDLQKSDDLGDAARVLRMYRRHQERPAPAAAPAKPANTNQARQRQIAAAVPVRGDGAPAPAGAKTDDDDFNAGFKTGKV